MLTRNPDDELLARLIDAIGKSDVAAAERIRFEDAFKRLKRNYQERLPAFEADVDHRALLRKLLANTRKRRTAAATGGGPAGDPAGRMDQDNGRQIS